MTRFWHPRAPVRSVLRAAAAFAVISLVAVPGARAAGAARPSPKVSFSSPTVVDPTHAYGEPDVKIAPGGTKWYDSGPWGTGTQRSIWNWSADGGHTFHSLHSPALPNALGSDSTVPCPDGTPPPCPGGGDTEISIDRSGKVYYADLAALVTLKTATWDPVAHSMDTGLILNGDQGLNGYDRQWFANWDPATPPAGYTGPLPVNYLVYAEAILGCCEAGAYSTDGITYTGPTVEYSISLDGNAVVDQESGTVLQAVAIDSGSDIGVAILTRGADPNDPSLKNAQLVHIANTNDKSAGSYARCLLPTIALDQSDNAYVAWCTRNDGATESTDPNAWQIWYSSAPKPWTSWSAPVKLSSAPSNQNVMPWATAGSDGRLAVVWYGTNDATHDPSQTDVHQAWNVYLAMVTGADTPSPSIQQVEVTRHPMHYGTICLEGLGCITVQGNRNLADFFQVETDPRDGAVVITYNDTSNELIQKVPPIPDGFVDHRGAPVDMVVRQNGGTGLFGTTVMGDPSSGSVLTDGSGDALFDPVYAGPNVPELDLLKLSVANSRGSNDLVFTFDVSSLDDLQHGLDATGAPAVDYVARWTGPAFVDPQTGTKNPIYYASVEVQTGGLTTLFFAGEAQSVDLCSVSACTPHIVNYPAPPQGGTLVTGQLKLGKKGAPDQWVITVPRSLVGNPPVGSLLESFSGFTLARNHSASLPITTDEGEAGITPIEIDGVCCRDAKA